MLKQTSIIRKCVPIETLIGAIIVKSVFRFHWGLNTNSFNLWRHYVVALICLRKDIVIQFCKFSWFLGNSLVHNWFIWLDWIVLLLQPLLFSVLYLTIDLWEFDLVIWCFLWWWLTQISCLRGIGVDDNCNGFKYCNLKLNFCGDE